MTYKNKIEGNIIIAKFDGWFQDPTVNSGSSINWFHQEKSTRLTKTLLIPTNPDGFKYHSDWNWLMNACHKWDTMDLDAFDSIGERKQYEMLCDNLDHYAGLYEIEPLFEQFVKCIKWYNIVKHT